MLFYLHWQLQLHGNSMKIQMYQELQINPSSINILVRKVVPMQHACWLDPRLGRLQESTDSCKSSTGMRNKVDVSLFPPYSLSQNQ